MDAHSPLPDEADESAVAAGCCEPLEPVLSPSDVEGDVRLLSAAANETRYEILRLLAASEAAVCVCTLEASLPVSQSAISHALSSLYAAGLVNREKRGRWRYYSPTEPAVRLIDTLDATRRTP